MAVTPDGLRIAAMTDDGLVQIWNAVTGRIVATLRVGQVEAQQALAFLPPDGDTLLAMAGSEVRVWRAPKLAEAGKNR